MVFLFLYLWENFCMQVFKFGGASVKDAEAIKNVASILKKTISEPTVVVISAMGKITNKLEELARSYFFREANVMFVMDEVKEFHLKIAADLFKPGHRIYDELENVFVELLWALEEEPAFTYNHHYDQIVSQGEILATKIVSAFLNETSIKNHWFDARNIIQTDNTYREGKVDYALSEKLVKIQLLPLLE